MKLVALTDSTYDTTYVKRDDFKNLAKDFLETPDISKKFGGKYTEERMMNNDMGQAVFIATPKDKNLEVRREEVRIVPGPPEDKVKSVYIEKFSSNIDSSVIKRMTWYANRKFQVITITQKKNGEEKTSVMDVIWNNRETD
jgi:glycerol-3-phosphate dehydrogenase